MSEWALIQNLSWVCYEEMYKLESRNTAKNAALQERITRLTDAGYQTVISRSEMPELFRKNFKENSQQSYVSSKTSLKARIYKNDQNKTIAIAFSGTDFSSPTSVVSAVNLAFGYVSNTVQEALNLVVALQNNNPEHRFVLTGASQGGAIAQYVVSQTKNTSAIVFNSQGLHPEMAHGLTENNVTHLFVEGESMSEDSGHLLGSWVQNALPVTGKMLPVSEVMSSIITNYYFDAQQGQTVSGWLAYRTTTSSFVRHWTGSVLAILEQNNGYNMTSLYQ